MRKRKIRENGRKENEDYIMINPWRREWERERERIVEEN